MSVHTAIFLILDTRIFRRCYTTADSCRSTRPFERNFSESQEGGAYVGPWQNWVTFVSDKMSMWPGILLAMFTILRAAASSEKLRPFGIARRCRQSECPRGYSPPPYLSQVKNTEPRKNRSEKIHLTELPRPVSFVPRAVRLC